MPLVRAEPCSSILIGIASLFHNVNYISGGKLHCVNTLLFQFEASTEARDGLSAHVETVCLTDPNELPFQQDGCKPHSNTK
jgi:hypothetical protein